jgi:hypothetical protein
MRLRRRLDIPEAGCAWPKIIELTLRAKSAKPYEEKWVQATVAQVHANAAERARLIAAVTIGATAFRSNPADPLTWHHVEGDNILLLVPRPIHQAAQHAGGFSIPMAP